MALIRSHSKPGNRLVEFIFFGNYFYGICAVALSIEASLQQHFPVNDIHFYILLFSATTLYYTKAYISESDATTDNPRTNWYILHHKVAFFSQIFFTIIIAGYAVYFWFFRNGFFQDFTPFIWIIGLLFPFVAAFYYGFNLKSAGRFNLREIGWLKPFVIGFTWAGMVTVYPIIYYCLMNQQTYSITIVGSLLFLKNFMFITVLGIMFDIKDYSMDYNRQLKTFVVNQGLRKTIFYIIIPLCILGLGSFITYGIFHHFSVPKIMLNVVSFVFLIFVAMSLQNRKSILYYLVIIDGLMLVKAICGIIAMAYF